jgi:serine/threonine-protein phosphatase 2A catalytic subunit
MDSKMDVDVGKPAQPHGLSTVADSTAVNTLDGWIATLMECKQLAESDVLRLCDRVSDRVRLMLDDIANHGRRQEKYFKKNPMCSQWYACLVLSTCLRYTYII